jgi:uncharacterized lipoprotein YajG
VKIKSVSTFLVTLISTILIVTGCAVPATTSQAVQNQTIPQLDKEIPAKIETATFSLG